MRRTISTAIAVLCIVPLFLTGCGVVPVAASAQPSGSATPFAAVTTSVAVQPTAAPSKPASPSPSESAGASAPPGAQWKVAVPYDLEQEKNSQKSVDEGHSPWRLDAAFVAQVFVSLQVSPGGIVGDYPIPYEDFKVTQQNDSDAVVEVNSDKSPTAKVYLKRLARQEEGGIWTVVGYDPK